MWTRLITSKGRENLNREKSHNGYSHRCTQSGYIMTKKRTHNEGTKVIVATNMLLRCTHKNSRNHRYSMMT